jgi:hypothetical protein
MNRSHRHGLVLVILLTASLAGRDAEAQPRAGERVFSVSPPPPIEAPNPLTITGRIVRIMRDVSDFQRFDGPELRRIAPVINSGPDIDWTPDIRVILPPPGERVMARRQPLIWYGAIPITTTNTQVATGRGNDAMLLGIELTLPWLP